MKKFLLFNIISLIILFYITSEQKIFIGTESQAISIVNARENLPLTMEFIHSVQKTPVIEELEFHDGEFILKRTKYKSQGVGLPFDEGEGTFYTDGDWFIFDDMNRHFERLNLCVGKGTHLKITLDGKIYNLYEDYPLGTKIIIKTF